MYAGHAVVLYIHLYSLVNNSNTNNIIYDVLFRLYADIRIILLLLGVPN